MEHLIKYFVESAGLSHAIMFLLGLMLNIQIFRSLGSKLGEVLSPRKKKFAIDILKQLEAGLLEADFRGDKTLVSNGQVQEIFKETKINLGLRE